MSVKWRHKTFWTLTFELLGRNITPVHLKIEKVGETALRQSWFWPTSGQFAETSGIFFSPGDSKLTPDGLALHRNGHNKTFRTRTFERLGRNIAPLHFKAESVAETALRTWRFLSTSARFPESWGIFSSPENSKLFFKCSLSSFGSEIELHFTLRLKV